jgi:periplasmic divalent cation tolerance protein
MTTIRFLYVPCPNAEVAAALAKAALHARLAACANIIPAIRSLYWWEGGIQDDAESLLILKTADHQLDALRAKVMLEHPYEVPCVATLALDDVNAVYAAWLTASLD